MSVARAIPDDDADVTAAAAAMTSKSWSVRDWLGSLGLAAYACRFTAAGLTSVRDLQTLSRRQLAGVLGADSRQHADTLVDAISALTPADGTATDRV